MPLEPRDITHAFAYAWWLTGDRQEAERALRAAAATRGVRQTRAAGDGRPALLAAVREAAISARTMCPASELALLHDAQGLPLDTAATLVAVDSADAGTELAHGRLEALIETFVDEIEHPQRLGGLAVGNPADVAHARQCASCAQVSSHLARGRDELRGLAVVDPPVGLVAALTAHGPASGESRGARLAGSLRASLNSPDRLWRAAAVLTAAVVLTALVAAVAARGEPGSSGAGASSTEPADAASSEAPPAARPSTQPARSDEAESGLDLPGLADIAPRSPGFGIVDARLGDGDPLGREAPLRVAVDYRDAGAGTMLRAGWTVDGQPFRTLGVELTGNDSTHIFGEEVPDGGWPPGRHQILLTAGGSIMGVLAFSVE